MNNVVFRNMETVNLVNQCVTAETYRSTHGQQQKTPLPPPQLAIIYDNFLLAIMNIYFTF